MQLKLESVPANELLPGDMIRVEIGALRPALYKVVHAHPRRRSTFGIVDVTIKLDHPASRSGSYTFPVAEHTHFTIAR